MQLLPAVGSAIMSLPPILAQPWAACELCVVAVGTLLAVDQGMSLSMHIGKREEWQLWARYGCGWTRAVGT